MLWSFNDVNCNMNWMNLNHARIIEIRSLKVELCVIVYLHASNSKKDIAFRTLWNIFVQCKQIIKSTCFYIVISIHLISLHDMKQTIETIFVVNDRMNRYVARVVNRVATMNRVRKLNLDVLENAFASITFNSISSFEHVFINFDQISIDFS